MELGDATMKIWTLDQIFRRWPGLWFRIFFEATLPTLAAVIWGINDLKAGSFAALA